MYTYLVALKDKLTISLVSISEIEQQHVKRFMTGQNHRSSAELRTIFDKLIKEGATELWIVNSDLTKAELNKYYLTEPQQMVINTKLMGQNIYSTTQKETLCSKT